MRIVIPGGSGQVGTLLARHFHNQGHAVTVLARQVTLQPWPVEQWDGLSPGPWTQVLAGADVVINLAGRSVNCRYHQANRRAIMDSRVLSTRILGQAIAQCPAPPRLWLNASTATIYRHALDRPMDELTGELGGGEPDAPDTWRFSIGVARAWEDAFFAADLPHTRRVALRSAMTMHPDPGSIFAVLSGLVRCGLGGSAGTGNQYVSWIHGTDFLRAIEFLITHPELTGPVNLCAPHPLPYRDFMHALRQAWGMPVGLPATAWMLEIGALVLRTESELVLKSRRVVPTRLAQAGFAFAFPEWPAAARDLVHHYRQR